MKKILTYLIPISAMFMIACSQKADVNPNLDIQGHRGCRGLMPENTIEGFIKAVELGVTTLELDVVISSDSQVVISHEPFFNHDIATHYLPIEITKENEKDFNIFKMTTEEIQKFDVGQKIHPKFTLQSKIKTYKPTLHQMVTTVEDYISKNNLNPIRYNIEIKHHPDFDQLYHPDAETFCLLVYGQINALGINNRCTVQSFNPECLNIIHRIDNGVETALLVENKDGLEQNLQRLTFKPNIYSPYFKLVDRKLIGSCRDQSIKVIPWTVNDEADIESIIKMGVDGIISDYPDKAIEIYTGLLPKL